MPGYALFVAPVPEVEAPLWRRLTEAGEPASIRELHLATHAHPNAIQHRLDRWVRAGLVTRLEGKPKRYAMNDDTPRTPEPPKVAIDGKTTPRAPTARDRLWRTMRVLPSFDLPTLQIVATTSRRSAEDMINCLQRAGYLRQLSRGNGTKGTWSTYRLIRNTGPRTPSIQHRAAGDRRVRELVDINTGRRTDISPAAVSLRKRSNEAPADGGVS